MLNRIVDVILEVVAFPILCLIKLVIFWDSED